MEIRKAKDVLRSDGFGTGRMEVARQAKGEVEDVIELSNEQVHGIRWQRGIIFEREETEREEGGLWRHGRSEG